MIVVVPTGGANLGSIVSAFARLGKEVLISEDPEDILFADRVILPGVGHARAMMARLEAKGLDQIIPRITRPVLGICLGMQILFEHSEEGDAKTLGIIPGKVKRVPERGLAIPHMGWNLIETQTACELAESVVGRHCYFVHSYCAEEGPWVTAVSRYGEAIPSVIRWNNFYGTQFHPERSGEAGEALLARFLCL